MLEMIIYLPTTNSYQVHVLSCHTRKVNYIISYDNNTDDDNRVATPEKKWYSIAPERYVAKYITNLPFLNMCSYEL